jgi:hypothetical protein
VRFGCTLPCHGERADYLTGHASGVAHAHVCVLFGSQRKNSTCADIDVLEDGEQPFECCPGSVFNPNASMSAPSQKHCCLVSVQGPA